MRLVVPADQVRAKWLRSGSRDEKHVEVWFLRTAGSTSRSPLARLG
jgi:hypothetical protein